MAQSVQYLYEALRGLGGGGAAALPVGSRRPEPAGVLEDLEFGFPCSRSARSGMDASVSSLTAAGSTADADRREGVVIRLGVSLRSVRSVPVGWCCRPSHQLQVGHLGYRAKCVRWASALRRHEGSATRQAAAMCSHRAQQRQSCGDFIHLPGLTC